MALIIEDGAGVANADSYQTEVDAQALALTYGIALPSDIDEAEIALRKGYLNINTVEMQLQGGRVSAVQTGAFPRLYVYANGFLIPSDEITQSVLLAQLYAASAIHLGVDVNAVDTGQDVKSFIVPGAFGKTYQDGSKVKVNSMIQGVYNSLYQYTKQAIGCNNRSNRDHEGIV